MAKNAVDATRSQRLNFRVSAAQDSLIRLAAESQNKSVSEFVLESATVAARHAILDQQVFLLDETAWNELDALLSRPAVFKPKLADLLQFSAD